MNQRPHTGLRLLIIGILLGLSLAPMLIVGCSIFGYFENVYERKVDEGIRGVLEVKRQAVDLFLSDRLTQLQTIANASSLNALRRPGELERLFGLLQARSHHYIDIGVIDQHGDHVAYCGPYSLESFNYSGEEWFRKVMARGTYISDVYLGFRNYPHFIIAVSRREGDVTWALRATVDPEMFNAVVQGAQLGSRGDAFLVNAAGVLQSRPRQGRDILDTVPMEAVSRFSGPEVTEPGGEQGTAWQGRMWLENKDWLLVLRDDSHEELRPMVQTRVLFLALLSGMAVLLAGGAVVASGAIVNRMERAERERAAWDATISQSSKMAALGKMAAGVAHEINNPLAIIKENAGWLKDLLAEADLKASPNLAEFADTVAKIELHVGRARDITHRLLGFARRMDPVQQSVNINELLRQTIAFLESEARFREIAILTELSATLPPIPTDPSQLQQVFLNIIDNAIDAIGKEGTVTVRSYEDADQAVVAIADTGPGIAKEKLDKIFDPFFTTKKVGEGTGLGLSISFGIIEKLGGRLTVESTPGKGTTFFIRLPRTAPAGAQPAA